MQAHKEFPDDAMSNFDIGGEPRGESEMKQFIPVSNSEMEPHYECQGRGRPVSYCPPRKRSFSVLNTEKKKYSRRSQCTFHFNLKKCSFFPPIRGYDKEIT